MYCKDTFGLRIQTGRWAFYDLRFNSVSGVLKVKLGTGRRNSKKTATYEGNLVTWPVIASQIKKNRDKMLANWKKKGKESSGSHI